MKPEIKQKWIAELRSGKYTQGKEKLCRIPANGNGVKEYCCLGVLTELFMKEVPGILEVKKEATCDFYVFAEKEYPIAEATYLPSCVAIWAGLALSPKVKMEIVSKVLKVLPEKLIKSEPFLRASNPDTISLAGLNDTDCSFEEIAAVIEADSSL